MRLLRLVLVMLLAVVPLQAGALSLVRDAEIERTVARLSHPVFKVAGLSPAAVTTYIINDRALQAAVVDGRTMLLFTGLLTTLETPEEVIGVIAHEVGHIAGGHLARRSVALRNARGPALLALLAGVLAGAAGGPEAGIALGSGAQGIIQRAFLRYNRGEEAAADQAALRYLERLDIDPRGLQAVLERFRGQEVLSAGNVDPYVLTHPLSSERLQLVERRVAETEGRQWRQDPELEYWFGRMQAKLSGFLDRPNRVLRNYEGDDSEAGLMARAVALHRLPSPSEAIATIDRLLAKRPNDPFYLELKGQILHENGRAEEAVPYYRRAVGLAPSEPLLKAGLGRTLLALDTAAADREALEVLKAARAADRGDVTAMRDLATAYARAGDTAMATLATAERFALLGRTEDAVFHAKRATAMLSEGSPGWLRARDIVALDRSAE
ncbi:MAG: M48 family metalloprotease [Pseudomonadota bacterium]